MRSVLLIEGEAGIGKTRLVDEFVRPAPEAGRGPPLPVRQLSAGRRGDRGGRLSTAYREHFGDESLEETLQEFLGTPVLIPAFAALLRGEPPPRGEAALTKDSVQTVFVHATRALADERPTVVLIDDLHFAPARA